MFIIRVFVVLAVYFIFLSYSILNKTSKLIPSLKKTKVYSIIETMYSTWAYGDRYYQTFNIIPNIPNIKKTDRILYVGIQWYQWLSLKFSFFNYDNVVFLDLDPTVEKYSCGNEFVAGDLQKIDTYFNENEFDCVIVSGIFFHYGLGQEFFDNSIKSIHKVLKNDGVLVTGITTRNYDGKLSQIVTNNHEFKDVAIDGEKVHYVNETLLPFKKTKYVYIFECFKKYIKS